MQAIPAAVGLGTSIYSGIQGKRARKKQENLAEQQRKQLAPLIQSQIQGSQEALGQAKNLYGMATPQIAGAESAIRDLQNFWHPTMSGDRNAIDKFFAPERRSINEGYRTASENIARFAPRGGGRVGSLARADIGRQGQLSDLQFAGRREGANQSRDLAGMLSQLGLGTGGLANSTLGASAELARGPMGLYSNQANRSFEAQFGGSQTGGKQMGGYLVDLFKGLSGGGKKNNPAMGGIYGSGGTYIGE